MTRGDTIRKTIQTDEGLANFMLEHNISDGIAFCRDDQKCCELTDDFGEAVPEEWCRKCLVEWLRQENEI